RENDQTQEIELKEIADQTQLEGLLRYCYLGELQMQLEGLLQIVQLYQIPIVIDWKKTGAPKTEWTVEWWQWYEETHFLTKEHLPGLIQKRDPQTFPLLLKYATQLTREQILFCKFLSDEQREQLQKAFFQPDVTQLLGPF